MPDLAKPNVIIPSWKGEMGTKGSLQLWLISFPLPEAEKEHAFQTPAEGPKADFSPELRPARGKDTGGSNLTYVSVPCCAEPQSPSCF